MSHSRPRNVTFKSSKFTLEPSEFTFKTSEVHMIHDHIQDQKFTFNKLGPTLED